jgi:hypothetical protein
MGADHRKETNMKYFFEVKLANSATQAGRKSVKKVMKAVSDAAEE